MVNQILLLSLIGFAFVGSVTPGPNNLMVMASGAAFGWRRTVPHVLGIMIGAGLMMGAMSLGLGTVLAGLPALVWVVKTAGALWLLWLAFGLARAALGGPVAGKRKTAEARPMRFHEAVLFQWINPKAWTLALAAAGAYVELAPDHLVRTAIVAAAFMVCAPIANGLWVMLGEALHRLLSDEKSGRIFGLLMAALLAATAVSIFFASPDIRAPG